MGLETATYVGGLNPTNPVPTDKLAEADDHLRLIKQVLQNTFVNFTQALDYNDIIQEGSTGTMLVDINVQGASVASTAPKITFEDTDALPTEKVYCLRNENGIFTLDIQDDGFNLISSPISINRTGTLAEFMNFSASNIILTGSTQLSSSLFMDEITLPLAPLAGKGQLWISDFTSPGRPVFTDDAGTDHQLLITVEDEGTPVGGPMSTIDFVGPGVNVTGLGADKVVTISGAAAVDVQDEGIIVGGGPHATLNFIGGAVTATDGGGGIADITISASPGGADNQSQLNNA